MFGMFFFLTQFLQDVLGYSPLATGLGFLPLTACLFLSSQTSARLAARVPQRTLLLAGFTLSALGLFWISHLSAVSGYPSVLGPLVLVGLGNGLAFVPLTSLALAGVAPTDAGAASGLVNVTQQIGSALGLALLVTVYDAASGSTTSTGSSAFIAGTDRAFLVSAGLLVLTIALSAVVLRTRPPALPDDLDLELDLELAAAKATH